MSRLASVVLSKLLLRLHGDSNLVCVVRMGNKDIRDYNCTTQIMLQMQGGGCGCLVGSSCISSLTQQNLARGQGETLLAAALGSDRWENW